MKTKIIPALVPMLLFQSLLAGDSDKPARAGALPPENPPACCAGETPAGPPGACCAASKDPDAKIEKFSRESVYQLDGTFTDDRGHAFTLGELRGRPVVLTMFFASCGYACPLLVNDMQAVQGRLPAEIRARTLFVLVSFDTVRDTPAALAKYRAERALGPNWILLQGDAAGVRELAALLGVKYQQDATGMFAHSNLVSVLNPAGEIVHQRAGLKGGLDETAAALAAAGRGVPPS